MSGNTKDLDARAAAGETVVEGGTGGKSLQAQQNLAEGQHFISLYHMASLILLCTSCYNEWECGGMYCITL
jgi:hypothetical protein